MKNNSGYYLRKTNNNNIIELSSKWQNIFATGMTDKSLLSNYSEFGSEKAIGSDEPDLKSFIQFKIDDNSHPLFEKTNKITKEILKNNLTDLKNILKSQSIISAYIDLDSILTRVSYYSNDKGIKDLIVNHQHTDIDLFTIIYPPTETGLQVLENGKWKIIDKDQNIIFLYGEMLEFLSENSEIKAIQHRVELEKSISERVSISVFINANIEKLKKENKNVYGIYSERLNNVKNTLNNTE